MSTTKQSVKVITDSTSDLPADTLRRWGVEAVPLTVHIGDEILRDGLDITPQDFYRRLPQLGKLPTTSQPSPGLFMKAFEEGTADGASVISLHISAKLSGTCDNARIAARNFPEGRVRVFDTQQVSAGIAMFVQTAVEMARNGMSIDEIEAEMKSLRERVKLIATVDTLEYLHKGGRIGGLRNFLGSLLSVKPILQLKDGEVQPLEQVRTRSKALNRVAELANLIAPVFPLKDIYISNIGPVIGAHTGPGTIGVCLQKAK